MRLTSIEIQNIEMAALVVDNGCIPIGRINQFELTNFATDLFDIITYNQIPRLKAWVSSQPTGLEKKFHPDIIPFEDVKYAPLYRHPPKIWGIGLNFEAHAESLDEKKPQTFPGSFMKSSTTIIAHGETIKIPKMSEKTTGEAELGIIIGKQCKNVEKDNWLDFIAGFTPVIDMTAEDILRQNPRYLTLSKNFDTFLSIGPQIITPDEIQNINNLKIATIHNGKVHAENIVEKMTFTPDHLVSFHSQIMTLYPGDIILSGTPQAIRLADGDQIECRISDFPTLHNPVIDLKKY